jgi:YbbR domain-containing protein
LLYNLVRTEKQAVAHGTVAVSFTVPEGKVLVSNPPQSLHIGLLGPASRIQRLRFEDLAAVTIDLGGMAEGYLKFKPSMLHLPAGLSLASIRPEGFDVRLAPLTRRELAVEVPLRGVPGEGFRVVEVRSDPARVTAAGPATAMVSLASIRTAPVTIDGLRSSIVARVSLEPPPQIDVGQGLTVGVQVVIKQVSREAILTVPVTLEEPYRRFYVADPSSLQLTIAGRPEAMAKVTVAELAARVDTDRPISWRDIGKRRFAPRIVGLPLGVAVRGITPATVTVARRRR